MSFFSKKVFGGSESNSNSLSVPNSNRKVSNASDINSENNNTTNTNNNDNVTSAPNPLPTSSSSSSFAFQVSSKDPAPEITYPSLQGPTTTQNAGDVTLTISPTNVFVKEVRELQLKDGLVTVKNVANSLQPQTVNFISLSDPQAKILTQTFRKQQDPQLETVLTACIPSKTQKRVERENPITVKISNDGFEESGIILGVNSNSIVLRPVSANKNEEGSDSKSTKDNEEMRLVNYSSNNKYSFSHLPQHFFNPCLDWVISSSSPSLTAEISYQCQNMKWGLEYNARMDAEFTRVHLTGWYTLENSTGAFFENANVVLVEKIRVAEENDYYPSKKSYSSSFSKMGSSSISSNSRKSNNNNSPRRTSNETRTFNLPRKVTLEPNTSILENAVDVTVPVKRFYWVPARPNRFEGKVDTDDQSLNEHFPVQQIATFQNTAENQLGLSLPAATCNVTVEDEIHSITPVTTIDQFRLHEKLATLQLRANVSEATLQRKRVEFHADSKKRIMRENFEIIITNKVDRELADFVVEESVWRWNEWDVTGAATIAPFSQKGQQQQQQQQQQHKISSFNDLTCEKRKKKNRISFSLPIIPPSSVVTITYSVVYSNW